MPLQNPAAGRNRRQPQVNSETTVANRTEWAKLRILARMRNHVVYTSTCVALVPDDVEVLQYTAYPPTWLIELPTLRPAAGRNKTHTTGQS